MSTIADIKMATNLVESTPKGNKWRVVLTIADRCAGFDYHMGSAYSAKDGKPAITPNLVDVLEAISFDCESADLDIDELADYGYNKVSEVIALQKALKDNKAKCALLFGVDADGRPNIPEVF